MHSIRLQMYVRASERAFGVVVPHKCDGTVLFHTRPLARCVTQIYIEYDYTVPIYEAALAGLGARAIQSADY